jgi:hypothetical protein
VALQQRDFGESLDDLVIDFRAADGAPARLSLQVKRALTISQAKTNSDFREIIRDSWNTLAKTGLPQGHRSLRCGRGRSGIQQGESATTLISSCG